MKMRTYAIDRKCSNSALTAIRRGVQKLRNLPKSMSISDKTLAGMQQPNGMFVRSERVLRPSGLGCGGYGDYGMLYVAERRPVLRPPHSGSCGW